MQNKASLIDLFDNCVDLFADITKLFLRAYFDAENKLIIKPCILVEE